MQFFITSATPSMLDGLIAAATKAAQAKPRLAELKVTFNLGEAALSFACLCTCRLGNQ